jgi:hypothetical protein
VIRSGGGVFVCLVGLFGCVVLGWFCCVVLFWLFGLRPWESPQGTLELRISEWLFFS